MNTASLLEQRPELIADQSNPQEVMAALRSVDEIHTEQQEILDWVLTDWVMTMISRPADLEGVVELHKLCRLSQSSLDESASAANFRQRWQAYADLLEGKRLALRDRTTPPTQELRQEPKILARLAEGAAKQSDFTELLQISAGRVSQLLALLESRGKITRKRLGKESWVMLAPEMAAGNAGRNAEADETNEADLPNLGGVRSAPATINNNQPNGLGRHFLTARSATPTTATTARH